ncbi:major facilitator superfamily protein [mine drainage metagenome]|uniref:Major facilitator superfamily protein n=1 Tax=mine drainage metagenome TaxID=410659 RepID=A0A1J5QH08_9ZZZZ
MDRNVRRIIAAQGLRAFGYGFTAVFLGRMLAARAVSPTKVGFLLAALIAGSAFSSMLVGRFSDRWGRRRSYVFLYLAIGVAGSIVAANPPLWVIALVALTVTLSTDVIDNGPGTTLEQAMLTEKDGALAKAKIFGIYNAVGALLGAMGALLQGFISFFVGSSQVSSMAFIILLPLGIAGAVLAASLSNEVEASHINSSQGLISPVGKLGPSRRNVFQLAGLFAVDAAGGGLITATFLAYYFTSRYGASPRSLGLLFFTISLLQAFSMLVAPLLARRFGLVWTMVGTHLPSNLLLIATAFAPNLLIAALLLFARSVLSQMDVPTRQALVMTVVTPEERTPAAAVTNSARYLVRPFGPMAAVALQQITLGAPLIVSGVVKGVYDLALLGWALSKKLMLTPGV